MVNVAPITDKKQSACRNTVSVVFMHMGDLETQCMAESLKLIIPCQHSPPVYRLEKIIESFLRHWRMYARTHFPPGRREDQATRFVVFCPKIMADISVLKNDITTNIIHTASEVLQNIDKHGHCLFTNIPPHTDLYDFGSILDADGNNNVRELTSTLE